MSTDMEQLEDDISSLEDEVSEQKAEIRKEDIKFPLYRLKANVYNETYYSSCELELKAGYKVIATTRYGKDICSVLGPVSHFEGLHVDDLVKIERVATQSDLARRSLDEAKEKEAFSICLEKIKNHNLPMKLVFAHYLFEEPKVLFFFTADARVDFRNLVRDLVSVFKMRIELRQIGVRDEARIIGGCGVCGRLLCCHGVTDKLIPVSIKMAKDQNLSLNSLKISGPCGRLLCCLSYEFNFYKEARKTMPNEGTKIPFDGTTFRVIEINVPAGRLKLSGEDGRYIDAGIERFKQVDNKWMLLPAPDDD